MSNVISVRCLRPYDLKTEVFNDVLDQFRNALYLPPEAFEELGIQPYDYVQVGSVDSNERQRVVTAGLESNPNLFDDGFYTGALRTSILSQVTGSGQLERGAVELVVESIPEIDQFIGQAERTYDDEVEYRVCHLSDAQMTELGLKLGTTVELYNPRTGGRIDVIAGAAHDDEDLVRIDVRSRQALDISPGEDVGVRNIEADDEHKIGLKRTLLKTMIDSREMPFNVQLGPDQDEYRSIVRMTKDMMDFLGIDSGDNVILKWRGETTKSQCLPTVLDEDEPPNTIKIPSTERDKVGVSVHDAVVVERDMWYVFREQMALSILGIFGVIIGVLQVLPLVGLRAMMEEFGTINVFITTSVLILLLSVFVVWLLLSPTRQECISHD